MFTFFVVLMWLHFVTAASYGIYLPPNLGLRADGGLCTVVNISSQYGAIEDIERSDSA